MGRGFKKRHSHPRAEAEELQIYGRWPVREALAAGRVSKVILAQGAHGDVIDEIMSLLEEKNVPYDWIERDRFQVPPDVNHQGVMALVRPRLYSSMDDLWDLVLEPGRQGPSLLLLDGIMDPQNLGSILRSAAFFGVPAVVIPKWRAANMSAAVVRASVGAATIIPVIQVSNLAATLEQCRKNGLWIVGADMDGSEVKKLDIPRPFCLVMGGEGEGLHALVRKKCDLIAALKAPGVEGGVSSLNVGVAAGIFLHTLS